MSGLSPKNPDKWIKSRLDSLESDLFEFSTANRLSFEDVAVTLKELRADLAAARSENEVLRGRLEAQETRFSSIGRSLEDVRRSMTAPRKILRDENGLITGVKLETEGEEG